VTDTGDARILERGYRRYEGERLGIGHSERVVVLHSVQRVLGIKRTIWQKIVPTGAVAFAYLPAIVFVGVAALVDDPAIADRLLPGYPDYYGFITAAILVFTAFVAPELLCTDRRTGMMGLYLASPLDRDRYLLAKAAAVGAVLSIVTIGPVLLLLAAYTLEGSGPGDPLAWVTALARILLGGLGISALHGSLSLGVSSLTDRRAVASAAIVVLLLVSGVLVDSLVAAGATSYLYLGHLPVLPFVLVTRIWGETNGEAAIDEVSTVAVVAANVAWTLLFVAVARVNIHRLQVTR
jgi:ABC-2 type transport system permease protein